MIKKAFKNLHKNFFDESLSLKYRIQSIFLITTLIVSLLTFATNLFIGLNLEQASVQGIYAFLCLICLFIRNTVRSRYVGPLLILTCFVYLPCLFITNDGINGTVTLYMILVAFTVALIYERAERLVFLTLYTLTCIGLCVLQFLKPEIFSSYPNQMSRVIDFSISIVINFLSISLMTFSVVKTYDKKQEQTESLISELEIKNKELESLSIHDPLTGAYNRRHLISFLEMELESCNKTHRNICVLMLDIDHFKKINDTFGHGFGDEVLILLTKAISMNLREYDMLARYGGEEFVAVLPVCRPEDAVGIAERIHLAIYSLSSHFNTGLTISIGLVDANPYEKPLEILQRADKCLYAAKNTGRNKTVMEWTNK